MVKAWESDFENEPDPYVKPHDTGNYSFEHAVLCNLSRLPELTETQVRRQLEEEEEENVRTGRKTSLHDVSPASFLCIALELEEQQ